MAKRTPAPEPEPDETNGDTDETNGETADTEAPKETTPPIVEPPPAPPANRIGLADDPAAPTYIDHTGERTHRLLVGPATYEHCGEDANGVWLYRQVVN